MDGFIVGIGPSWSLLLNRFALRATVFYAGDLCGSHSFGADDDSAHVHVIEQGPVDLIAAGPHLRVARDQAVEVLPGRGDHHRWLPGGTGRATESRTLPEHTSTMELS
jgi:hypothetical protein